MDFVRLLIKACVNSIVEFANLLGCLKVKIDCNEHRIFKAEIDIARRYIWLSSLLKWNKSIYKECFLTTFSLNPTIEMYNRLLEIAQETTTNFCQYHLPLIADQPSYICDICGIEINIEQPESIGNLLALTGEPDSNPPTNDPHYVPGAILDTDWCELAPSIQEDILTLIHSLRNKNLSWSLDWKSIRKICLILMIEENKLALIRQQFEGANDVLKFVRLDTRVYRHLPEQDCPGGVEEGYENYDEESEEETVFVKKLTEIKSEIKGDNLPSTSKEIKKKTKKIKIKELIDTVPKKRGRKLGSKNGVGVKPKYICTRKPGERRGRKPKINLTDPATLPKELLELVNKPIETENEFNYQNFDTSLLEMPQQIIQLYPLTVQHDEPQIQRANSIERVVDDALECINNTLTPTSSILPQTQSSDCVTPEPITTNLNQVVSMGELLQILFY